MSYAVVIEETGAPEILFKREVPIPELTPGAVLVRNRASAVNFIDTLIRRGSLAKESMPALPHVLGVEGAGIVEAVGEGVTGISVGDRVAWMGPIGAGGYGTHSVIAAPYVARVADGISFSAAAAIPVNAVTAWHMLVNLGQAKAGDTVLVHAAAGGVGTMLLQIAKYLDLTTIASVSSEKMDFVRALGADHVIDRNREQPIERVKEITRGRGVALSLNPISGNTLAADLEILAPFGTAVIFGFLGGLPAGTFAEDFAKYFQKSVGVRLSDIYTYLNSAPHGFHADLSKVFDLLGRDIIRPQITELPLEEASEAHRRLESGKTTGKFVLSMD